MQYKGMSKYTIKQFNQMQILRYLKSQKAAAKSEISKALGLTRASITLLIDEMTSKGLLTVSNKHSQKRKMTLYRLAANYKFAFGITLHKDAFYMALSNIEGALLNKISDTLQSDMNESEIAKRILKQMNRLLKDNCLENNDILGVALAYSASVDSSIVDQIIAMLNKNCPLKFYALSLTNAIGIAYFDFHQFSVSPQINTLTCIEFYESLSISIVHKDALLSHGNLSFSHSPESAFFTTQFPVLSSKFNPIQQESNQEIQAFSYEVLTKRLGEELFRLINFAALFNPSGIICLFCPSIDKEFKTLLLQSLEPSLKEKIIIFNRESKINLLAACAVSIRKHLIESGGNIE